MKSDRAQRQAILNKQNRIPDALNDLLHIPLGPQAHDAFIGPNAEGDSPPKAIAKTRAPYDPDRMNQLETRYAEHLEAQKILGAVRSWRFQALSLRLAGRTYSKPDFWVVLPNGEIEIHEVKGPHVWEDSRVKAKLAAEFWPEFAWVWVTEKFGVGFVREEL